MMNELTQKQINEICNKLIKPTTSNLQILVPLFTEQLDQIYEYAHTEMVNRMAKINIQFRNPKTIATVDNLKQLYKVDYYEYIIKAIEAHRATLSGNVDLQMYPLNYELIKPNKEFHDYQDQQLKTGQPKLKTNETNDVHEIKLITLKNDDIINKLHTELIGYFQNKDAELLKALKGEKLNELLIFPHNQNKFVEVFRRLKYNGFLLNKDTETMKWICATFLFSKIGFSEPKPFNENTVWNNLNKGKGEPTKRERICITDWLPYKSQTQIEKEV